MLSRTIFASMARTQDSRMWSSRSFKRANLQGKARPDQQEVGVDFNQTSHVLLSSSARASSMAMVEVRKVAASWRSLRNGCTEAPYSPTLGSGASGPRLPPGRASGCRSHSLPGTMSTCCAIMSASLSHGRYLGIHKRTSLRLRSECSHNQTTRAYAYLLSRQSCALPPKNG